jgi:hypothetical protein
VKHITRWAWTVVLGTALSLSWWSLFVLAHRFGMPAVIAGMVSLAIDGVALVLADLAMQRAMLADSAAVVKLFTMCTVGLSAWLNFEHAVLWGFPLPIRVLFAAPSVLSGIVFELKLRNLHRARLHELDQVAPSLPRFGFIIWVLHPFAALRKVSQIAGSRLRSVPVTVMDWQQSVSTVTVVPISAPVHPMVEPARAVAASMSDVGGLQAETSESDATPEVAATATVVGESSEGSTAELAAPASAEPDAAGVPAESRELTAPGATTDTDKSASPKPDETPTASSDPKEPKRTGRKRISDEVYAEQLRTHLVATGEGLPSARQVAQLFSIGQDRARRLVVMVSASGENGRAESGGDRRRR